MTRISAHAAGSTHRVIQLAAVTFAIGLGACTSAPQQAARVEPQRIGDVVQDDAYVDQVERIARRRGVGITWINIPSRRVADESSR